MARLTKVLLSVVVLGLSAVPVRAASITDEYTFSYTTVPGSSFTLTSLFYGTDPFGGGSNKNLLSSLQSDVGKSFSGSGSFSTTITVDPSQTYFSIVGISGSPQSYNVNVSAVPLPDTLPLFGLALAALAAYGYRTQQVSRRSSKMAGCTNNNPAI